MQEFLFVCFGGAIGTGARYLLLRWSIHQFGTTFPAGTLIVNIAGSFAIGLLTPLGLQTNLIPLPLRIVLITGVLGGFTTYSSFNQETLQLFAAGDIGRGLANMALMMMTCLLAGGLGLLLARRLTMS